jgi:GNAT superfamily N-acetyltransferase
MSADPVLRFRDLAPRETQFQALVAAQGADLIKHGYTAAEVDAMGTGQFRASWLAAPAKASWAIAGLVGQGAVVGWIHLLIRQDNVALLESLFVLVTERHQGYARRLVRQAIVRAAAARIEILEVYALDRDLGNDALWGHLLKAAPNASGQVTVFTTPPVVLSAKGWHVPISQVWV